MTSVCLPDLGEGIHKATISCLYVKTGDQVNEGDNVVECVTDKASFDVPASVSGRIKEIVVKEGDKIAIGCALLTIQ
ncbi:MAG: biotin/lipoyl-containing protein [Candidatus Omnitrophota bacterium]